MGPENPNWKNAGWHICETCGGKYHSYNKSRRFCSKECHGRSPEMRDRLARMAKSPKPTLRGRKHTCPRCGVTVPVLVQKSNRQPCEKCRVYGKRSIRACQRCGAEFRSTQSKKFCGPACRRAAQADRQRGDASHLWKGGKTSEAMVIRNSKDYAEWRSAVFAADGYSCQMCGQRGGKLAAHHILPFRDCPELRVEVSNGISLCWPCHRKIHMREHEYVARFAGIVALRKDPSKPPSQRKLTPDELAWRAGWAGQYAVVTTEDEALQAVGAVE